MVEIIKNDEVSLIINTVEGRQAIADSFLIRREALNHKIAYATTMAAAKAICASLKESPYKNSYNLQELHEELV